MFSVRQTVFGDYWFLKHVIFSWFGLLVWPHSALDCKLLTTRTSGKNVWQAFVMGLELHVYFNETQKEMPMLEVCLCEIL
jgi:hypothetical protein